MACGGFTCTRTVLAALNVFYIAVAIILISVAAYAKAVAIIATVSVVGGIIACGVFLLLIAIIGLIGSIKHHQVLLFFYMIILFLLFVVQFAIACACLALTDSQQKTLYTTGWENSNDALRQKVQNYFACCGSIENERNESRAAGTAGGLEHPSCAEMPKCKAQAAAATANTTYSLCCTSANSPAPPPGNATVVPGCPYNDCWHEVESELRHAVKVVGILGLLFSFTEIIGIWLALRYRNLKDPRANPGAFL
jgi:tetraspanin-13/31